MYSLPSSHLSFAPVDRYRTFKSEDKNEQQTDQSRPITILKTRLGNANEKVRISGARCKPKILTLWIEKFSKLCQGIVTDVCKILITVPASYRR